MEVSARKKNAAIALGFFDGVHLGHRAVVARAVDTAKENGLTPCVFTFTAGGGASAGKAGQGLICTEDERRAELLRLGAEEIFCPDFESFKGMTGEAFVRELLYDKLGAAALCCGEDFRFGRGASCGTAELRVLCGELGMALAVVPEVLLDGEPVSSTRIRTAIAGGDIKTASRLLGRAYSFTLKVEHGRKLGRTIGFPTINQHLPQGLLCPRFGVYASFALVGGVWRGAVTNIGVNPTVTGDNIAVAETYITGVDERLYGETITVAPVRFMRGEQKFEGVQQLKEAIARDADAARGIREEEKAPYYG